MKKDKLILITTLILFPTIVSASNSISVPPLGIALFMEAFVTIHMSLFVLKPLSKILAKQDDNKLFWKMFMIRIGILLFFDIFITTAIALIDFMAIFIGAFILVPVASLLKNKSATKTIAYINDSSMTSLNTPTLSGIALNCTKCGTELKVTDNFCTNCGEPFKDNNVTVNSATNTILENQQKISVMPSQFDPMFNLPEDKMVEEFINRELVKAGIDKNSKLIPYDILKRKKVLNVIFSVLVFVFISLIFFHFPVYTYIIGLVILIIFYKVTRNYNLIKYLKKQLKARPNEKVSNIVMSLKTSFTEDNSKNIFKTSICLAVILPLIIFINPRILYEKTDNGYAVRYYTFGLTNFTTATIPQEYKGQKVVSLRGNTFSNMFLLKEVNLPNTITEIRGQAFKNNFFLKEIELPSNLEYLGGGAFYNCSSLTSIELPDTLTYLGGEAFYNAESLKSAKLSNNIPEIKGNTFENCISLVSINIPDSVTRIGGHAFYGCSSLNTVTLTETSKLEEIGSSAFRKCNNLYSITLPSNVYINSRAFKESPTNIKKIGEINYGSLIDSDNYTYDTYTFIHTGESKEINMYRKNALLQNAYITLEKVTENNDSNEFTLKYSDDSSEQTFTLSIKEPYMIINDNIAIEITADYVFRYDDSVSINMYYN